METFDLLTIFAQARLSEMLLLRLMHSDVTLTHVTLVYLTLSSTELLVRVSLESMDSTLKAR